MIAERSICFSNPCMSGGTCLDETYGYRCSCRLGYSGMNCQRKYVVCLLTLSIGSLYLSAATFQRILTTVKKSTCVSLLSAHYFIFTVTKYWNTLTDELRTVTFVANVLKLKQQYHDM